MPLELILLAAPLLLFSMVAHEYAHGYAALRQGDPTAYQLGRLTWNPIKHIDPFMTVLVPIMTMYMGGFLFGGAKPVPVVPRNYRHYRRGDIIVSLAGIAVNALITLAAVAAVLLLGLVGRALPAAAETCAILQVMMCFGIYFNIILVYFNLLPIPPLDGSHVVKHLLPPRLGLWYSSYGRYGLLVLVVLFVLSRQVPVLGQAFMLLLAPINILARVAFGVAFPYVIPSEVVPNPFLVFAG